jgi:hypothetical protein
MNDGTAIPQTVKRSKRVRSPNAPEYAAAPVEGVRASPTRNNGRVYTVTSLRPRQHIQQGVYSTQNGLNVNGGAIVAAARAGAYFVLAAVRAAADVPGASGPDIVVASSSAASDIISVIANASSGSISVSGTSPVATAHKLLADIFVASARAGTFSVLAAVAVASNVPCASSADIVAAAGSNAASVVDTIADMIAVLTAIPGGAGAETPLNE